MLSLLPPAIAEVVSDERRMVRPLDVEEQRELRVSKTQREKDADELLEKRRRETEAMRLKEKGRRF